MPLKSHFQNLSLTPDQDAALDNLSAFLRGNDHIFILQGYAGTGKTTLIKGIKDYLNAEQKQVQLMAPTGRAAKVLRDKTGLGKTIHKSIYNFKDLQIKKGEEKNDLSLFYQFPIDYPESDGQILIVDEASMISSRENKNEFFRFGTDILLNDLLTFTKLPNSSFKTIFVGDTAQLPPVGDNTSKALEPSYFESLGLKVMTSKLTTIRRQENNAILQNATKFRKLIGEDSKPELSLIADKKSFLKIENTEVTKKYTEFFPNPEIGQGVIISFSNKQCLEYNSSVREKIFPNKKTVTVGDLLMVNQNNYNSYEADFLNGETIKVVDISTETIPRKNIPVYVTVNGKKIKKHVSLTFRKITVRKEAYDNDINCFIIDSLLNSPHRGLSVEEFKALYIDFKIRFDEGQKNRKENKKGNNAIFKESLKNDPFFNALQVKYGYAITCHKAQGGEWDKVFVDYFGRTSLKDDPLRWAYTATTRAVNACYATNEPNVKTFSKFQINEIQPLTNIPQEARSFDNVPISPYHSENDHRAKSFKFWEIEEKIQDSPFQIKNVESLGGYQERYTISFQDNEDQFDVHHNKAGVFKKFKAVHPEHFNWNSEVEELLNKKHQLTFNVDYKPSLPVLKKLYGIMQMAASENDVSITNIVEKANNYYVVYYLKTAASCALIQFYFNGKQQITRAMPNSALQGEDEPFKALIQKINAYVV